MGLGAENGKVGTWEAGKSKGGKKKKEVGDVEEQEIGCWVRLRFLGSCISSRSKVDTSVSGTTTHYGNFYFLWKTSLLGHIMFF
jgi:hypothetical protein